MADKKTKSQKSYDPRGKELEALNRVYNRYYEIRDSAKRSEYIQTWDRSLKNWEANRPEKKDKDWQSNYFVPLTTSVVESILSEMVDQTPRPILLPRSSEDQAKATVMQHIFNYTWEVADGDIELYKWMKDTLIFGTGFVQEYFWEDRRIIQVPDGMEKNKIRYKDEEVLDFADSYMECVSPYDLFWDEKAREINRGPHKANDMIRRYVMDINSFRDFFSGPVWNQLDNAKYVEPGGDTEHPGLFKPPEKEYKDSDVEVLWNWARRPKDALEIVANGVVMRLGPNPYRHKQLPFAKAVDVTRPHQFGGKGEPDLLDSMQEEVNTYRRLLTDRGKLDVDKMVFVSNRETLDDRDLIARPHGIIPVDDPKNIKFAEYGDVPNSVRLIQDEINKDAIKVTGIEDRFQSIQSPTTATQAAILKESVIRRIRMKLRMFEKGALVDVGRQRLANIIQFYSQPTLEKIVGDSATPEFKRKISQANRKGRLIVKEGEAFEKKFNEIRIPGKRLVAGDDGTFSEEKILGTSFFEADPEFFIPSAKGGFDIRFEAGSTMPVSKPLMQTKATEMFDRLMQVADLVGYDMTKIADQYVEAHEKSPADFKKIDEQAEEKGTQKENIIEMANLENEMISKGKLEGVPENGTPYSTPSHTELHFALISSKRLETNSPEFRFLVKHATGEVLAQQRREEKAGQTGGGQGQQGVPTPPGGSETGSAPKFNQQMKDIQPNQIQGGGEVPQQPGSRGLLSGVKNFFRGGA